jgi:NTP pyrophosphatase (non-canonical NTP hydrolase)
VPPSSGEKLMVKVTFHEYELMVKRLMAGDDLAWALGLAGETGEVVELIKKLHYHGGADKKGPITPNRILNECGDVLWYLTAMLNTFGYTLHDCIDNNYEKLAKRFPNGIFNSEQAHAQADELKETI